ncbi:MAG: choice-of-anchor tandem repeat GloVer-containing protein [Rhizomicrobium sp.]|jgi:uncharacterized repeat protein (TIGR03803 family)
MKICSALVQSAATFALFVLGFTPAIAATEKVLYNFPADAGPYGQPVQGGNGTLYGTAAWLDGNGAVYRLKEKNGVWKYKTLFDFDGNNGVEPDAGALFDRSTGILYGATARNVYSLAPAGRGWNETVLHNFNSNGTEGFYSFGMLLKDKSTGNLYGTTYYDGQYGCGTAFQLAPTNGNWTFSTIYSFQTACYPWTQLKPGAKKGTLIGASQYVSPPHAPGSLYGQVFELKQTGGVWNEQILHTFSNGTDGAYPYDLDAASDGTIYGITEWGGQNKYGVVFQLTPNGKGYTFSVIYTFLGGQNGDGENGVGITFDPATGYLYGTTSGGDSAYKGTVFRLVKNGSTWTETVLHTFTGGADGAAPQSRPTVDRTTGYLYGTTLYGGTNNGGTVYEIQP